MTTSMKPPSIDRHPELETGSGTFLFFGIAMVVLGILALFTSVIFTISTVLLLGSLLIAAGIMESFRLIKAHHHHRNIDLAVFSILLYLVAGVMTVVNPAAGAISLTLIASVFLIVSGVARMWLAAAHREDIHWGWFFVGGLLNLFLGTIIALGWPVTGLWVIGMFVGIEMLFHGIAWIALSSMKMTRL